VRLDEKTYCPMSGQEVGDAERRARYIDGTDEFVKCPECGRVLVATPTGKFRQHQPRGRATASLDYVRDTLWEYAKKEKA
jgi:hypothetical protein